MTIDASIERALKNIAKFGDTDIFPFLFERHLFFDNPAECKALLLDLHGDFKQWLNDFPPTTHDSLTQVRYTGFRWATQIEPFWNAYYLALVISLADDIEATRIPIDDKAVFSYRYQWSETDHKLFSDSTWNDYRKRSIELCDNAQFVVVTDVSDFYPRVYHHRIEVALQRLPSAGDIPMRIMALLSAFSKVYVSYGLPIGGPASRILAELALNPVDKHLRSQRIRFCRYADDYCVFCNSKSDAYRTLVLLSEKLFNEGLVLQKTKTKILSTVEFQESRALLDPDSNIRTEEGKLLNISIRFDPYSETAEQDYETLAAAVGQVDVIGILGREIAKTNIDTAVSKQAINAIRAMDAKSQGQALRMLLDQDNLRVLSPVFVTLMRAVRGVYDNLSRDSQALVDTALIDIYEKKEYVLSVEVNLAFYVLALAKQHSAKKEEILVGVFNASDSPIVRRIIISCMANWQCHYWISDVKRQYGTLTEWEKRTVIVSSYCLGDEGKHWRDHTKATWNPREVLVRDWFSKRAAANRSIPV